MDRRTFFKQMAVAGVAGVGCAHAVRAGDTGGGTMGRLPFKISLAQWSLHTALRQKKIDHLDFAKIANGFGLDAIEYVNQFFMDRAKDKSYLAEMKRRAAGEGVWSALIMIDREGPLGDAAKQAQTVENHKKWVEAAAYLGCHSIRVNAQTDGKGTEEEQAKRAAEGLRLLAEYADPFGLDVVVENHGGLSSKGSWLASVMRMADHPRAGALPDFGNFRIKEGEVYDAYKGVEELMPHVKAAVSAKSHEFDKDGNETQIDYLRMLKIVTGAGYHGYLGIEYEGKGLPEMEGIAATKRLLERTRARL